MQSLSEQPNSSCQKPAVNSIIDKNPDDSVSDEERISDEEYELDFRLQLDDADKINHALIESYLDTADVVYRKYHEFDAKSVEEKKLEAVGLYEVFLVELFTKYKRSEVNWGRRLTKRKLLHKKSPMLQVANRLSEWVISVEQYKAANLGISFKVLLEKVYRLPQFRESVQSDGINMSESPFDQNGVEDTIIKIVMGRESPGSPATKDPKKTGVRVKYLKRLGFNEKMEALEEEKPNPPNY